MSELTVLPDDILAAELRKRHVDLADATNELIRRGYGVGIDGRTYNRTYRPNKIIISKYVEI